MKVLGRRRRLDQDNFRRALAWGLSHDEEHKALDLAWHLHHLANARQPEESERGWRQLSGRPGPAVDRAHACARGGESRRAQGRLPPLARRRLGDGASATPRRQRRLLSAATSASLRPARRGRAFEAAACHAGPVIPSARAGRSTPWVGLRSPPAIPAARELFETSRADARALGNEGGVGEATLLLGQAAHHDGDHLAARGLYEESLGLLRRCGDRESRPCA
jgi:hypothetical protein